MIKAKSNARSFFPIASAGLLVFFASILLTAVLQVHIASAQSDASSVATADNGLHAAVVTLLLADSRAASLPQKEFDDMVNALVAAAQKKGLSARDISWRPQPTSDFSQNASVGEIESCNQNSVLCMLDEAFGFAGPDISIPMWFGICSAILLLIIGGMIEIHRRKHLAPSIQAQPVK